MNDQQKYAANIRRWRMAVATHDVENPTHNSHGIGVSAFDLERLGFEDGETLWPGYTIQIDGKTSGNFRVLCDGEHQGGGEREAQEAQSEPVHAVSRPSEPVPA